MLGVLCSCVSVAQHSKEVCYTSKGVWCVLGGNLWPQAVDSELSGAKPVSNVSHSASNLSSAESCSGNNDICKFDVQS